MTSTRTPATGLDRSSYTGLIEHITSGELTRAGMDERFARAAWSRIIEPGDSIGGALIAALGAVDALSLITGRWNAAKVRTALGDDTTAETVEAARQRWIPRADFDGTVEVLRRAARSGTQLLTPDDAAWPARFNDLGTAAPAALWIRGNLSTLASLPASIALVGSRAATGYGEHVAMECAAGLADRGYTVVTDGSYGISGMATRATLASRGKAVVFLGGGVDRPYPSGHDALHQRVAEEGVLVSEVPCGTSPTKWRFLQRNRLVAAATAATAVLEAGWRSGSLNTAGHALALGRPVGAVPGPVTSAASSGTHRLIRDHGATLVTGPGEIAELAPILIPHS